MHGALPEIRGVGRSDRLLTDEEVAQVCERALSALELRGKRVLAVIPDLTRTCPVGPLFRHVHEQLSGVVSALDFMIALGTHPPMTDEQIYRRVEISEREHRERFADVRFFNHQWSTPGQLVEVGRIPAREIAALSDGRFEMEVAVTCNKMVLDYDHLLIIGPVFPHEVAGFSGGNKYIAPGIAGQEIIDFFHWLGAVITNAEIIGQKDTPVRAVIDRAAAFLPVERSAFCMVVEQGGLAGLYHGSPEDAWSRAADLSAELHVEWVDAPYRTVLSCAPEMYRDLWVGGKCMYKLEPVVADGGELIIYAPHITEVSRTHGAVLEEIGYHVRDYFTAQWDRFKHHPWGVLAHSTHVRGAGTYQDGVERPRVEVVLATGLSEETCRRIGLGYLDPANIDVADYQGREDEGVLCVPRAGERLYRLRDAGPR